MLGNSTTSKINKFSVYCLPPNMFHIGYSGEFSIGLVSSFRRASQSIVDSNIIDEMRGFFNPLVRESDSRVEKLNNVNLSDLYTKSKKIFNYRRESNAYLSQKLLYTKKDLTKITPRNTIHHIKPFSIKYLIYDKKGYLFFRGNKLVLKRLPIVDQICYFICENESFKVGELLDSVGVDNQRLVFKIIELLEKSYSIKIHN